MDQIPDSVQLGILGLFITMVGVMAFIIRSMMGIIERIIDRFVTQADSTIGKHTEALSNVVTALAEVTTTLREHMAMSRTEHETLRGMSTATRTEILDAIGKARATRDPASL